MTGHQHLVETAGRCGASITHQTSSLDIPLGPSGRGTSPPFFLPVTESRLGRTCERSQSLGWGARQEVLTESSPVCGHHVGRGMGEGVSVGVNRGTRQVCRHTCSTGRCQLCPQRPQQQDACRDGGMVPNEAPDPGLQWNQPLGLQEQGLSSGWPVLAAPRSEASSWG